MLWRKLRIQTIFLLLAIGLAAGNVWIAAARSTIPLQLDEDVTNKEIRREKHPGRDDVYLLHFRSGRTLQVDGAVFDSVIVDASFRKTAWSKQLAVDGQIIQLTWSADFFGMVWAMAGFLVVVVTTAICTLLSEQTSTHSKA